MKRTNYEKETILLFNEADSQAEIYTFNAKLLKKLRKFAEDFPEICILKESTDDGGYTYAIQKDRLSINFKKPLTEEEKKRRGELAKLHGFGKERDACE